MPRYIRGVDANHAEIVRALEKMGASVWDTSMVGRSFPDVIVGAFGLNELVEIKTPKGKLKKGQDEFRREWRGSTRVIRTVDDAASLIADMRRLANVPRGTLLAHKHG